MGRKKTAGAAAISSTKTSTGGRRIHRVAETPATPETNAPETPAESNGAGAPLPAGMFHGDDAATRMELALEALDRVGLTKDGKVTEKGREFAERLEALPDVPTKPATTSDNDDAPASGPVATSTSTVEFKRASASLRRAIRQLKKHDFTALGLLTIGGAKGVLERALESMSPPKRSKTKMEPGTKVTIRAKFVETYKGIIDDAAMGGGFMVVLGSNGKIVRATTPNGEKVAIQAAHLEIVS